MVPADRDDDGDGIDWEQLVLIGVLLLLGI